MIDIVIACKSEFIEMSDLNVQIKFCLFLLTKIMIHDWTSRIDEERNVENAECKTVILLSLKIYDSWIKTMSLFITEFSKECMMLTFLTQLCCTIWILDVDVVMFMSDMSVSLIMTSWLNDLLLKKWN